MEIIEHLEENLMVVAALLKLILEAVAILCVFLGLVTTTKLAIAQVSRLRSKYFYLLRLKFGSWLVLALECQLGADILATTVAPSFESLGKLAIVALIRTFLNYFLNQELEEETKHLKRSNIESVQ